MDDYFAREERQIERNYQHVTASGTQCHNFWVRGRLKERQLRLFDGKKPEEKST